MDAISYCLMLFNFSVVGTVGVLFVPIPLLVKQVSPRKAPHAGVGWGWVHHSHERRALCAHSKAHCTLLLLRVWCVCVLCVCCVCV